MPSTPLEVLAEIKRAVSKAAEKIKEGESLCTKAVDSIATILGTLLEDDTTKKIRQSVQEADERISATKEEMLKLSL